MTEEEVYSFLEQQRILYVGSVKPDGGPHVVPVWFVVLDGKLYFRTQDYKVKARNIADNPRVACASESGDRYVSLKGVMIEGLARIVSDENKSQRVQSEILARYRELRWKEGEMPKEWMEARAREHYVVVEITPEKISSWDNSKLALLEV